MLFFLTPSMFALHGDEALWYEPASDVAQREHMQRAAVAFPVQAIHVEWPEAAAQARGRDQTRAHRGPA